MLRGQSILRPNPKEDGQPDGGTLLPMPEPSQLRRIFDDRVRDAFAGMPDARSAHFQAAHAIYAALSVDAGDRDTSTLDPDRWERAIKLATGGIEKYQGRHTPLPYGYEWSQFNDELARRAGDIVESGRLGADWTKERLLSLPLQAVGDGRYVFMVGDSVLAERAGETMRPVVVDFGRSAAFRASGHGIKAAAQEPTVDELAQLTP